MFFFFLARGDGINLEVGKRFLAVSQLSRFYMEYSHTDTCFLTVHYIHPFTSHPQSYTDGGVKSCKARKKAVSGHLNKRSKHVNVIHWKSDSNVPLTTAGIPKPFQFMDNVLLYFMGRNIVKCLIL